jgi:chromosome segregation ATPase
VIAGLAVAVGVAVLAWISPPLFEWLCYQGSHLKQDAEDSIPPEQRIDMLKGKLKGLDANKAKYVDAYAKEAVAVDQLAAEVDKLTNDVALQWKKIDLEKDALETQKASITFDNGKTYKRSEVEKALAGDFESVKTAEGALDAKKALLDARQKALATAKDQISALDQKRDDMSAELTKMEADLKLVRMQEAAAGLKVDDNDYAKLESEIKDVNNKILEKQKALDVEGEFKKGPVDPLGAAPATDNNILKQIDDYKAAKNGTPKTDVTEKK